ncbi:AcrR family transcriptional regulator [Rhizobium sp. BK529]|uniref:CerR family C-terminal domain-containing protein n=1 Tax=unclassified Rhizobium TaxID=2613769 RepID=UPI001053715F|nr:MULTISPECIES: CerR family C-terminal domain-containing protein [unclassified Rhizobium]MBB3589889.1 AcrR family transcriptional regulator [Rhizobium sp. BK529]TCS04556.1 TetR family transcriptional regulator [Rhizobium sp. BK418]
MTDEKTQPNRAEITREKLLSAALDVFGRYGFDGTSTRQLSEAAGVNLQAIPYYFGSKEGLYVATSDYLVSRIERHVGGLRQRIGARLMELAAAGQELSEDEARLLLTEIATTMVSLFVSKESEPWARFVIREQMEPTEAFARVYQGLMGPMIGIARRLIGTILQDDPASEHVRLRTLAFVGNILIFRVAHAAVLAQMEWQSVGPEQLQTLCTLVAELVGQLQPAKGNTR